MAVKYQMNQNRVYKALIRPVLYVGLPMELLALVCGIPFLLGVYTSVKVWGVIPVLVFGLGQCTKKDPFFFHLLYLKWKTTWSMRFRLKDHKYFGFMPFYTLDQESRKAARANKALGCQVVMGCKYTSNSKIGVSRVAGRGVI